MAIIGILIPILKYKVCFYCNMANGTRHRRNENAIATLAFNLKKYRTAKKLTIQELSNILEVDYSQIGRMERGVVNPNVSIIFDIADALGVKPSQLIEHIP